MQILPQPMNEFKNIGISNTLYQGLMKFNVIIIIDYTYPEEDKVIVYINDMDFKIKRQYKMDLNTQYFNLTVIKHIKELNGQAYTRERIRAYALNN